MDRYFPFGPLSLQAVAHQYGSNLVDILPFPAQSPKTGWENSASFSEAMLSSIDFQDYDTIGLSTVGSTFHLSLAQARWIKQKFPALSIWMGGPHASAVARDILVHFVEIDAIFIGEGEVTFSRVLERRIRDNFSLNGIKGIFSREDGYSPRPVIPDLDELPRIIFSTQYLPHLHVMQQPNEDIMLPIEVSRGCPGHCTFCSTKVFWGNRIRHKSGKRILSEMEELFNLTGISSFEFIGDNFAHPQEWLRQFCLYIQKETPGLNWYCDLKLNRLDQEDLKILWESGCRGFFVGVESGSQITLNRIKKEIKLPKTIAMIENARQMGFKIKTSFIIGFPWETPSDIDETFNLHYQMLKMGIFESQLWLLCPLPGTDLFANYDLNFDPGMASRIAMAGIAPGDELWNLVSQYPAIFPQFHYYRVPKLNMIELIATLDTASQMSYLYSMDR